MLYGVRGYGFEFEKYSEQRLAIGFHFKTGKYKCATETFEM
jgi:hypothetical protein